MVLSVVVDTKQKCQIGEITDVAAPGVVVALVAVVDLAAEVASVATHRTIAHDVMLEAQLQTCDPSFSVRTERNGLC